MADEERQKPGALHPVGDLLSELVKAGAVGFDHEGGLHEG